MKFSPTKIPGVFLIEPERLEDERGFFARFWCEREFREHGLNPVLKQCSISHNAKKGTLRGMHYQEAPYQEAKLVRCTRGAIFDVALDLRRGSPTFKQHLSVVLTAENGTMLYVPEGVGHGFQTLEEDSEVLYLISQFHSPAHSRGVRWDDPAFGIPWPAAEYRVMSERDRAYPDFHG